MEAASADRRCASGDQTGAPARLAA